MFIKSLKIDNNGELIRYIPFHKGVNLIVSETTSSDDVESANNVGKTTVLRLIDFCLGAKNGKSIYKDPEFKEKSDSTIEEFLTKNNIVVTLTLQDDLDNQDSRKIIIRRNFLARAEKLIELDGIKHTPDSFLIELVSLMFNYSQPKPSFRQIISKNIRDGEERLNNTLKILHKTVTKQQYEALYLFWLGVDNVSGAEKTQILKDLKSENDILKEMNRRGSLSQAEQALLVVNQEIKKMSFIQNAFNSNPNYSEKLKELYIIRPEISEISEQQTRLSVRKSLILESKKDLEQDSPQIDTNQIREIYNQAKALIPNLQKTFEETIDFHKTMLSERVKYITKELPEIENTLGKLNQEANLLLKRESEIMEEMKMFGAVEEIAQMTIKLNKLFESKGKLEAEQQRWKYVMAKIEQLKQRLKVIDDAINEKHELIQSKITSFNSFFSEMSNQLYGERFILSSARNDVGYELNISNVEGNPGTGKKKGQIAAFDLAYIQFADAENIKCPHFVLHDQIETVHRNQLRKLITDVMPTVNGQYIAPILKGKFPPGLNITDYQVLFLSPDDKLFKV
jgi:uncharacterized protein YydD (DUF2326 family)